MGYNVKKMLKSKEGISPILATLLLIVIAVAAVIVTYAWVMTFTTSTTSQSGAILTVENVRYYNDNGTSKVEVTIRNSGTADAKVVEVYQGTSPSNLQTVTSPTYTPTTQMANVDLSIKITFNLSWTEGTTYHFKVVTEAGQTLPFSQEA